MDSTDRFLDELDRAEQDSPAPESSTPSVDPLTAVPGQQVDAHWCVERVLDTGATARALLVTWTGEDDEGEAVRLAAGDDEGVSEQPRVRPDPARIQPLSHVEDLDAALAAVRTHGGQAGEPEQQPYGLSAEGTRFWLLQS